MKRLTLLVVFVLGLILGPKLPAAVANDSNWDGSADGPCERRNLRTETDVEIRRREVKYCQEKDRCEIANFTIEIERKTAAGRTIVKDHIMVIKVQTTDAIFVRWTKFSSVTKQDGSETRAVLITEVPDLVAEFANSSEAQKAPDSVRKAVALLQKSDVQEEVKRRKPLRYEQ